jgi:cytochrome c5
MPDTEWHRAGWATNDCMRCHETGVEAAPVVRHDGLPPILLRAKCRTCHVIADGEAPTGDRDNAVDPRFEPDAFPPMIPNSGSHLRTWTSSDCLLCHESGVKGAPIVKHEDLPAIYLRVKCRTCHVQVRSDETEPW